MLLQSHFSLFLPPGLHPLAAGLAYMHIKACTYFWSIILLHRGHRPCQYGSCKLAGVDMCRIVQLHTEEAPAEPQRFRRSQCCLAMVGGRSAASVSSSDGSKYIHSAQVAQILRLVLAMACLYVRVRTDQLPEPKSSYGLATL